MPAAMTIDRSLLTVDQSLVDNFLARVERFTNNINRLQDTITEMKEKFMPASHEKEAPVQQAAAPAPVQDVVTADDIDIDALLSGIDLGVPGQSM